MHQSIEKWQLGEIRIRKTVEKKGRQVLGENLPPSS
jgi:hypothetical protein